MINVSELLTTRLLLQSFPHWKVNRIEARTIPWLDFQFDKRGTHDGKRASKQLRHVYSALLWDEPIARDAHIRPVIARGSHSFTCHHALTNHTCLYSPAAGHRRPLAGTPLRDGQAELGDWLYTQIDFPAPGVEPSQY